jgi:hypothetical protein
MSVIGLKTSYADIAYASVLVDGQANWDNASDEEKESALQYARIYIDTTYSCSTVDMVSDVPTVIPDFLKTVNSLYANEQLGSDLFLVARNAAPAKGLASESVKADVVDVKKSYDTNRSNSWQDPFPSISGIMLSNGCKLRKGAIRTVALLRR